MGVGICGYRFKGDRVIGYSGVKILRLPSPRVIGYLGFGIFDNEFEITTQKYWVLGFRVCDDDSKVTAQGSWVLGFRVCGVVSKVHLQCYRVSRDGNLRF